MSSEFQLDLSAKDRERIATGLERGVEGITKMIDSLRRSDDARLLVDMIVASFTVPALMNELTEAFHREAAVLREAAEADKSDLDRPMNFPSVSFPDPGTPSAGGGA